MSNLTGSPTSTDSEGDKKAITREKILQAALTCFANKGYHKTTMDDIVAQSGLSKGALYWHFKNKQDLFFSLIEWFMLEFSEEIFHAWTDDMSAADKIRAMTIASVEGSEQLVPFFKVLLDFWAQTTEDEQLLRIFDNTLAEFQNQVGAIIEQGIANGEFRPVNASHLSLALFGVVDSLLLYKTLLGDKIDMHGSAESLLEVLLEGLKR